MSLELVRAGRIEIADLHLVLGEGKTAVEAVNDLTLTIEPGELVCVLGPSGCGKSSLLGAIAGLIAPTRGSVAVDGAAVVRPGADRGLVFQQHTLLPWRSIVDNVAFGLQARGVPRRARREAAHALLGQVGLAGFERHYPAQLSGGMQQRAELARVLINEPAVLLMDEPFAALDALTRLRMQELFIELWGRRRPTVVFVTHDVDEAILLGDRLVVLGRGPGRIAAELPVELARPRGPELVSSAAFVQLRRRCLDLLRAEPPVSQTTDERGADHEERRVTLVEAGSVGVRRGAADGIGGGGAIDGTGGDGPGARRPGRAGAGSAASGGRPDAGAG